MTTEEQIAVMRAYSEGHQIQMRLLGHKTWWDCKPIWNWAHYEYRVKHPTDIGSLSEWKDFPPEPGYYYVYDGETTGGPFEVRLIKSIYGIKPQVLRYGVYLDMGRNIKYWGPLPKAPDGI